MPISRINPDGTVKIVNNKTGQVLDVSPEELPKYSPGLVGQYQQKLQEQEVVNQASQAVAGGGVTLDDLPAAQKLQVITKMQAEGKPIPTVKGAAEKKKQDTVNSVTNLIGNLEKNYQGAGGGEVDVPILSRIVGAGKNVGGALGFNQSANVYNKQKEGFIGAIKSLAGESGPLTDQDVARLSALIPGLGARPDEAKALFNDLRSQVEATYGGEFGDTTINPKRKGVSDVFLGGAKSAAQDINAGAVARLSGNTRRQAEDTGFETATSLEQQAMNEQDPKKKKEILKQAAAIYQGLGSNAQDVRKTFSEDVYENPALRGLDAASEITSVAGAPGVMKSAAKTLANPKAALSKVFTSKEALGQARDQAARGVKVDTSTLIQAGDDYVKNIDPAAAKTWETLKPSITESTDLPQLLTKISNWGNKAYTQSGDKRAITEGLLKSHLYEAGRNVIKKDAPEVAEITAKMAKQIGREKFVKKSVTPAVVGGAASAAASIPISLALYKLFGHK